MVRIKMNITAQGSSDGIIISNYKEGCEYNVSERLARNFVEDQRIAERVLMIRRKTPAPSEKAVVEKAPEVKKKEGKEEEKKRSLRVYQLADELDVSSADIIAVAKKLDISVSAHTSSLSGAEVERIEKEFQE